jgi:hypothetical protein
VAFGSSPFAVHRLTTGRVVSFAVVGVVLLLVVDTWRRGQLGAYGAAACLLLALLPLVYVLGIRPALLEGPTALEVRNPLRTTVIPWSAVSDLDVVDVLRVRVGEEYVRCFAVPRRRPPPSVLRSAATTGQMLPAKDPDRGWQPPVGEPRSEALAQRLRDMRDVHGRGYAGAPQPTPPGPVTTRWAPDALVALAVGALLLVAALALL